jgi:hypothetical protein
VPWKSFSWAYDASLRLKRPDALDDKDDAEAGGLGRPASGRLRAKAMNSDVLFSAMIAIVVV